MERFMSIVLAILSLLIFSSCGGGSGSGGGSGADAPVIYNVSYAPQTATLNQGGVGSPWVHIDVYFDYSSSRNLNNYSHIIRYNPDGSTYETVTSHYSVSSTSSRQHFQISMATSSRGQFSWGFYVSDSLGKHSDTFWGTLTVN